MLSYKELNIENKEILILLSPGISDSAYWNNVIDIFKSKYHIFAIDYPGRRKDSSETAYSVKDIAELLSKLIESKNLQNINIVGYSLGSAITIELLLKNSNYGSRLKHVVLIAPGEYLKRYQYIINIFFFPAKYSNFLRLIYRKILLLTGVFNEFPKQNLDIINQQWLSIINWELPQAPILYKNVELINFDKDIIVDSSSKKTIERIFPTAKVHNYPYTHFLNTGELRAILQSTEL